MKVLVACLNGMGSSQMIKMKIKKVFQQLDINAHIDHLSVGEAKSVAKNYDAIFCSTALVNNFTGTEKTKVFGLKNLLSEDEIKKVVIDNNFK